MTAREILYDLGATSSDVAMIGAEVNFAVRRQPSILSSSLEDLWATAIMTYWMTRKFKPNKGGGYIRIRVRGAISDVLKHERKAVGRVEKTFYYPWYRPSGTPKYCEMCGNLEVKSKRRFCGDCAETRERIRLQSRRIN